MELPAEVIIREVSARDGLQVLRHFIPTEKKLGLIDLLRESGCRQIEVSSFVSPQLFAQFADVMDIAGACERSEGVEYSYLIPGRVGMKKAAQAGIDNAVFVMSASEAHNMSNLGRSVDESIRELLEIAGDGIGWLSDTRVDISTAFGYEAESRSLDGRVVKMCRELSAAGYQSLTLCDSTGVASPEHVYDLCMAVRESCPGAGLGLHLHQAGGREYASVLAGLRAGVVNYDAAVGGIGGCPYAPEAGGNIATEILVEFFRQLGIETGIDPLIIAKAAEYALELESVGE